MLEIYVGSPSTPSSCYKYDRSKEEGITVNNNKKHLLYYILRARKYNHHNLHLHYRNSFDDDDQCETDDPNPVIYTQSVPNR